jgi:hypothetical protein
MCIGRDQFLCLEIRGTFLSFFSGFGLSTYLPLVMDAPSPRGGVKANVLYWRRSELWV